MLSIKLHISVLAFFSFFSLQNLCMENKSILLPKEMVMEVEQYLSGKDHLSAALTCKSWYTAFGYHITAKDYLKTLVKVAQAKKVREFDFLIRQGRPLYITEEIESVKIFFKKIEETKKLTLIDIYGIDQTKNSSLFPLQPYGISNEKEFNNLAKIVRKDLPIANLLYYQGYDPEFFEKLPLVIQQTIMHKAVCQGNLESLRIAFEIPGLKLNDRCEYGCTPISIAFIKYSTSKREDKNPFVIKNRLAILKAIVQHKDFKPNDPCNFCEDTPLYLASLLLGVEGIDILLNYSGTNITIGRDNERIDLSFLSGIYQYIIEQYYVRNKKSTV